MNLKDLMFPLILTLAIILGFNYFFGGKEFKTQQGSRVAPKIEEINRPLNFEVDFVDQDLNLKDELQEVETQFSKFVFSNIGASIQKAEFKHDIGKKEILMNTVEAQELEDRAFLLALDQKTPLNYKLIDRHENDDSINLIYQTQDGIAITKKFIIYKKIPKLDLEIDVNSKLDQYLRLFYPAPVVPSLKNNDTQGLADEGRKIVKLSPAVVKEGRYWETPTLFGSQDRYFIHSLVSDPNNFIQRGYFKSGPEGKLNSVLESSKISNKASWKLSFYFGPKKVRQIQLVDSRLSATLEYGWLEPICMPLLKLLNFIYGFVYNFGWAIVILTLLIKLLLLPFSMRGQRKLKQGQKKQKEFQQKLRYIQEKYKDDKQRMQAEQAALVRQHGLPGFGGCLPMLIQIPIFFSLQRVLYNSIELYKAPFLWINDLSSPDPYYILPLICAVGIVSSMGEAMGQGKDIKQKMPQYAMALVFSAVMFNLPAGLVLYIALSTLLTSAQNLLQSKFQKV